MKKKKLIKENLKLLKRLTDLEMDDPHLIEKMKLHQRLKDILAVRSYTTYWEKYHKTVSRTYCKACKLKDKIAKGEKL